MSTRSRTRRSINMTLPKDAILNLKFKLVPLIPFPGFFPHYGTHNYVRVNCRIQFYMNTKSAFFVEFFILKVT